MLHLLTFLKTMLRSQQAKNAGELPRFNVYFFGYFFNLKALRTVFEGIRDFSLQYHMIAFSINVLRMLQISLSRVYGHQDLCLRMLTFIIVCVGGASIEHNWLQAPSNTRMDFLTDNVSSSTSRGCTSVVSKVGTGLPYDSYCLNTSLAVLLMHASSASTWAGPSA
jgi:hypothetical protein